MATAMDSWYVFTILQLISSTKYSRNLSNFSQTVRLIGGERYVDPGKVKSVIPIQFQALQFNGAALLR